MLNVTINKPNKTVIPTKVGISFLGLRDTGQGKWTQRRALFYVLSIAFDEESSGVILQVV